MGRISTTTDPLETPLRAAAKRDADYVEIIAASTEPRNSNFKSYERRQAKPSRAEPSL